jgi:hypothetical protein
VDVLDEADPRAPTVNDKNATVVRELVRINHHRNCLMCHAPGNTDMVSPETLTAQVPIPGEPLPMPSQGYQNGQPDILIRIDEVTVQKRGDKATPRRPGRVHHLA